MNDEKNLEKFYAKIYYLGETLVLTVPKRVATFGGYKAGDEVVVYMKKQDVQGKN